MPDRDESTARARDLCAHLAEVEARIAAACRSAGRAREEVTLIAVSKTRPPEDVLAAYGCGLRHFGENRPEELAAKVAALAPGLPKSALHWHMIGHVQSRKAAQVVASADMVHSVDTLRLAARLDRYAGEAGRTLPVLVQVNVSGEESKFGFAAAQAAARDALVNELGAFADLHNLSVRGLMTMAPLGASTQQARDVFGALRTLAEQFRRALAFSAWEQLSMGMTDDYEAAIAEGATLIRVGRAIFGPRNE
ncbi:MAG: YggS family pyridoxal phosphate-dependent enzyme [Chloroflexi bacterium]|nr:YggS family pyridoxal phosphate-dependent enzyme [Chloroflexota bacterium]